MCVCVLEQTPEAAEAALADQEGQASGSGREGGESAVEVATAKLYSSVTRVYK